MEIVTGMCLLFRVLFSLMMAILRSLGTPCHSSYDSMRPCAPHTILCIMNKVRLYPVPFCTCENRAPSYPAPLYLPENTMCYSRPCPFDDARLKICAPHGVLPKRRRRLHNKSRLHAMLSTKDVFMQCCAQKTSSCVVVFDCCVVVFVFSYFSHSDRSW